MSDIACLCAQVKRVVGISFQFTNLKKWGLYSPLPPFYRPWLYIASWYITALYIFATGTHETNPTNNTVLPCT